jgi:uracil phosphoribosyltransferase
MATTIPPNVHVSKHPCLRAKLSQLRSQGTNAREAKMLINEISTIVACEALADALDSRESGTVSYFRPLSIFIVVHISNVGPRLGNTLD